MPESPCYSSRVDDALAFVADAFRDKTRKRSTIPYLSHLLHVAALVLENGGGEDQFLAGLLHDVLEDIPTASPEMLRRRFGDAVADMVVGLSDATVHPKPPWEERKRRYVERLAVEPAALKLVSACDKLHNASSILRDLETSGDAVWEKFNASKERSLWYYRRIVEALGRDWSHPLMRQLCGTVAEIHRLAGAEIPEGDRPSFEKHLGVP